MILNETVAAIADAIREKTGKSELIKPVNFGEEIKGISAGGSGESGHIIKPNGWYWKTTDAFNAVNLEVFVVTSGIYEMITEKEVADFAIAYMRIGQLTSDDGSNNYLAPITHIQEAFPKMPPSAPSGLVLTSVKDFFIAQGMPEDSFLSTMESMGLIPATEEEYMAAREAFNA